MKRHYRPGAISVPFLLALAVIGFGALTLWFSFELLQQRQTDVDSVWNSVEPILRERYRPVREVVESVKTQELPAEIADGLITAHTRWESAVVRSAQAKAASDMESALAEMLLFAENREELSHSTDWERLVETLSTTEEVVQRSWRRYNRAVRLYNATVRRFPTVVLATILEFTPDDSSLEGQPTTTDVDLIRYRKELAENN